LTVPDIRAYNRFSVFLSFFVIVISGLWLQMQSRSGSLHRRTIYLVFIGIFMVFSLYDQLLDKKMLVATQENDIQRAREERIAVERLELELPPGAFILQLPFTGFPPLAIFNKMESYDHIRPYIWSQNLRWSWPSFSQRHRAWQSKLSVLQGEQLIRAAILSGFDAIWIDRFAYADNGNSLIESLTRDKATQIELGSNRFVVIDLRDAATNLKNQMSEAEFSKQSHNLLGDEVIVEWGKGFYSQEHNANGRAFRWAKDEASMTFRNSGELTAVVCASFNIASPNDGRVSLDLDGKALMEVKTTTTPKVTKFSFIIQSGEAKKIRFISDLVRLEAQIDPRKLYFYVMDFAIITESKLSDCQAQ
jgi:phosphoglycerol transferase